MKHEWTDLEFVDWTLLPSEAALSANKTRPTRLGLAVLLNCFQYAARFPLSMQEVPTTAVTYIARQVGVPAEEFSRYDFLIGIGGRNLGLGRLIYVAKMTEIVCNTNAL